MTCGSPDDTDVIPPTNQKGYRAVPTDKHFFRGTILLLKYLPICCVSLFFALRMDHTKFVEGAH